jgi:hypothetical protein
MGATVLPLERAHKLRGYRDECWAHNLCRHRASAASVPLIEWSGTTQRYSHCVERVLQCTPGRQPAISIGIGEEVLAEGSLRASMTRPRCSCSANPKGGHTSPIWPCPA